MGIVVKFFATFRALTGHNQIDVPIKGPMTLRHVLDHLFATYGEELRNTILDNGNLRRFIKILVNGRAVQWLANLDTLVREGDTIAIFPPIGGG